MRIPVPEKGIDVRKLRPIVAQLASSLNNFEVSINQDSSVSTPSGNLVLGDANAVLRLNILPVGGSGSVPPWEKWIMDDIGSKDAPVWDIWFGDGDASFVKNKKGDADPADPICRFEFEVGNPYNDTLSAMALKIGDDTFETDVLEFSYLNGSGGRQGVQLNWTTGPEILLAQDIDNPSSGDQIDLTFDDGYGKILMRDTSDNGLRLTVDTFPQILLADVYDDPESGNYIEIDLNVGPEITLGDDSGYKISLDLTDLPNVKVWSSDPGNDNSIKMDIDVGPQLYLYDGTNSIDVNINDIPEILINGGTSGSKISFDNDEIFLGYDVGGSVTGTAQYALMIGQSVLSNGDLNLGSDGTIEIGDDGSITIGTGTDATVFSLGDISMPSDGTISIGTDGSVTVGDSVLTDGDLDLGTSGTLEWGNSCGLSDGDIDLGATGSVTMNGKSYIPHNLTVCDDITGENKTLVVLSYDVNNSNGDY